MPKPALVDLNLIRSFVAIYETRSLTAAAARLYVTQPAVSQALARLRRDLNDPLFRREGRAMEPSPLAVSLFPGFRDAIAGIDRTIDGVVGFDPALSSRRARIALSELGEFGYFPAIFRGEYEDLQTTFDFFVDDVTLEMDPPTSFQIGGDVRGERSRVRIRMTEPIRSVDFYAPPRG